MGARAARRAPGSPSFESRQDRQVFEGRTTGEWPTLRALATRAPYFYNGAAKNLRAVVDFYDVRFNIGFTDAEKADLVAFLSAL